MTELIPARAWGGCCLQDGMPVRQLRPSAPEGGFELVVEHARPGLQHQMRVETLA